MMRLAVILVFMWSGLALAQGGPPLIVDDPATPGPDRWEINLAGHWLATKDTRVIGFPYVDFNYGWGEHVQLKLETGWATQDEQNAHTVSGLTNYLAGTKIRFLDEEKAGVAVSTYPQAGFRGPLASKDERINEDGSHLILPVEMAKSFDRWGVNPEVGVDLTSRGDTTYFYGVAMSFEVEKEKEILWEIRGRSALHSDDHEWLYNIGTRWSITRDRSLILSAGHSFRTFADDEPFLMVYLGTQFLF